MSKNSNSLRATLLVFVAALMGISVLFFVQQPKPKSTPVVEVPRRQLIQRDGRWFRLGETNAFTGNIVETQTNGTLISRSAISNGLADGWSEMWYANGQMSMRECFKNGVSDGLREKWFESGRKMSEASIVNGKITGTFQRWFQNGQLAEKIRMRDGQPEGAAWSYYPSGFVKAEVTMRDGQQLSQKSWRDGELKSP